MKRVYTAPNLPDAHLLRDLLRQAGIAAHVFNENAASLIGFVPVSSSQPQVWIAQRHQESHAKDIIADYQNRAVDVSVWHCHACGESNPGEFELCWQCGSAK
ncbi:MAG: DUF2007 domain-containing protein [Gammaproteobacteria bacterium]|nr:DUF2007 domain-containing protein [Gammaproteobacteria bacterium]